MWHHRNPSRCLHLLHIAQNHIRNYNKQYFPDIINNTFAKLYITDNENNETNISNNKEKQIKLNHIIINKLLDKIKLYKVLVK